MEDVLDLYEEEYDPRYPTVCLDEKPVVLHAATRPVLPVAPGRVERQDYEYVRQGTANLFVLVEPLAGWRHVAVTERRTKADYAQQLRYLADAIYPQAEYIRLVQDNLNTHALAALYEVFPPAEARRIASRFEVHYTPKHGSWLNMAEIEISVFQRGCLARPVADMGTLRQRVDALEKKRNAAHASIHWQFTSQQARTTLADLYPVKHNALD
jgi:DDE superfamily endonuclease